MARTSVDCLVEKIPASASVVDSVIRSARSS